MIQRTFRASVAGILAGAPAVTRLAPNRLRRHAPTVTPSKVRAGVVLTAVLALLAASAPAAGAGSDKEPLGDRAFVSLRACDQTGCYVAWAVVDSDGDGVNDADEVMAGTDPHDPHSRPGLQLLFDLGVDRRLPSFEAGRGAFIAFPAEIVVALARDGSDLLGAFPVHQRKDALTRAGIDLGQLAAANIDLSHDGLTMGLGEARSGGSLPGTRVGGIDARLVGYLTSDDDPGPGSEHGGVIDYRPTRNGGVFTFADGVTKSVVRSERFDGIETKYTNADGTPGVSSETQSQPPRTENGSPVNDSRVVEFTEDGSIGSVSYISERTRSDGSKIRNTETTIYHYDDKGNVVGQTPVHVQETETADGDASTAIVVEVCDAEGKNCEVVMDDKAYRDPDADTTIVTYEMVDKTLRVRGAAITVLEGWAAPGFENEPADPRNPTTIALVDGELAQSYLLVDPPRITSAQPETRDDLPNPYLDGGGCWPKCG